MLKNFSSILDSMIFIMGGYYGGYKIMVDLLCIFLLDKIMYGFDVMKKIFRAFGYHDFLLWGLL